MKHRRTREIVIELTSLLDVVMILIFAVLLQNSQLIDKKNNEISGIEAENEVLQGAISDLNDKVNILEGEKEEIGKELQEALDKVEQSGIDELLGKLDDYENQIEIIEAIKDYVYVYYVSIGFDKETDDNKLPTNFTYGALRDEDKKVSVEYDAIDDFSKVVFDIETDIVNYINKNMAENAKNKYFYVVLEMEWSYNYTFAYNYISGSILTDFLSDRFNNENIYVVKK